MESVKKALLVMDFQIPIVNMIGNPKELLDNVCRAIAKAHQESIPVIYTVVGFRKGMPEISGRNKSFALSKERLANADVNEWMKIHRDIAPQEKDMVVVKRRVSAFTGSDLEVLLRGQDIRHLMLTGITTSGVVLSTLREAADKDYVLTVITDCCADADEEVHRVLTEKVFPRQAETVTLKDWCRF